MDSATDTLVIPVWANGPDGSGNGGWSAGLLAGRLLDEPGEGIAVNLRLPPPIGRELQVVHATDRVELRDGEQLVAEATRMRHAHDVPDQVRDISLDAAAAARVGFPFRDEHPFPHCLVCGTSRDPELPSFGLHCGPVDGVAVDGAPVFADTWRPAAQLADAEQPTLVARAACWAALDCPSAAPVADPHAPNPIVLARIAATVLRRPRVDEPHVVAAWHVDSDGRKHGTRSVIIDREGVVLATAEALWIEVRPR